MITASLATFPGREPALRQAIESLLPQVDQLWVYLNEYTETPPWLYANGYQNLFVLLGTKHRGDLGDAGKFFPHVQEGYHLTCDDDLLYDRDYVTFMTNAVERYDRQAVVSLHGRRITAPMTSYYRDRVVKVRCLEEALRDEYVHIPGTGTLCYHSDAARFTLDDFPQDYPLMADVHVGVKLQKEEVPCVAVAHPQGLVKHLKIDMKTTIHHRYKLNDAKQTERVNGVKEWRLFAINQKRAA